MSRRDAGDVARAAAHDRGKPDQAPAGKDPKRHWRVVPVAATLAAAAAAVLAWVAWDTWLSQPWTRDGRVRVYVVTMAPEVAGRIVELRVRDNQFVRKGDVLMVIDPADYAIAVSADEAALKQAAADMQNKQAQAERRQVLTTLSTSVETKQSFAAQALISEAAVERAQSQLAQARVNLGRTRIVSPVNGWVTNLQVRQGDYATVGQRNISVVDADSFWLDAYFEETALSRIRDGDPARIHLMGYRQALAGHVDSVARGIQVSNAETGQAGLATVNPVFTWSVWPSACPCGSSSMGCLTACASLRVRPRLSKWTWVVAGSTLEGVPTDGSTAVSDDRDI